MMMHEPLRFEALRGTLTHDAPLARHTSWRAGGRADVLYVPADRDDLATFVRQWPRPAPLTVIGLGSNLLVRDGGVRGAVVVMHDPGAMLAVQDGLTYSDAGAACPKLARFAAMHGCAEAEFLAGIPGTVGGALAMNAGCYGGETWRHVARVEMLDRDGGFAMRTPDAFRIGYRTVTERDGSRAGRDLLGGMVPVSTRRRAGRAGEDPRAAGAADRDAAAVDAERGQRVPQPSRRPCGAPDRGVRSQGLRDRRRARFREARELHRQPGAQGARRGHRSADRRTCASVVREKTGIELEPEVRIVGECGS